MTSQHDRTAPDAPVPIQHVLAAVRETLDEVKHTRLAAERAANTALATQQDVLKEQDSLRAMLVNHGRRLKLLETSHHWMPLSAVVMSSAAFAFSVATLYLVLR